MNNVDKQYKELIELILSKGRRKQSRAGETIGIFGHQMRFDLSEGFPLLTTKKVFWKGIVHELLWFLSGSTNIKYLVDNGVNIWNADAYRNYDNKIRQQHAIIAKGGVARALREVSLEEFVGRIQNEPEFAQKWGELGEGTYGGMWRAFPYAVEGDREHFDEDGELCYGIGYVDQIQNVLNKLKTNPDDRRMIVSAWHPHFVDHCVLPPCHVLFQFQTEELTTEERWVIGGKYGAMRGHIDSVMDELKVPKRRLNIQMYQRSVDTALGLPFNIASYSLLLEMVAHVSNMVPGDFVWTGGDVHIYTNHIKPLKEQLLREPKRLPYLLLGKKDNLFDYTFNDIWLQNYLYHPAIEMPLSVG